MLTSYRPKWLRGSIVSLLCAFWAVLLSSGPSDVVTAQIPPFLSVPYQNDGRGYKDITSYFDNDAPNYTENGNVVLYNNGIASGNDCDNGTLDAYPYAGFNNTCIWYDGHAGVDFDLAYEPVFAAANAAAVTASGWVDWSNRSFELGLALELDHGVYRTTYGHLSALAVLTTTTVMPSRGSLIGTSGNTGNSGGAHLHFELSEEGVGRRDPFRSYWVDGEWANEQQGFWRGQIPLQYGTVFQVDDGDANFATTGTWTPVAGVGTGNDMRWANTVNEPNLPTATVTWTPPRSGIYDVQVFIPSLNATTWAARYCLHNGSTTTNCMMVDQFGTSDRWLSLGVHAFDLGSGSAKRIWLGNNQFIGNFRGTPMRQVGADAVRFRVPNPLYIPGVFNESGLATPGA